jgi:hypothetical protein
MPHVVFENFSPHPELRVGIQWLSIGYNEEGGNLMEGPIELIRVENRSRRSAGVRFTGTGNKQLIMTVAAKSVQEQVPTIADRKNLLGVAVRWPFPP